MKNAICSIVSNNYFSQVLILRKSVKKIYGDKIDFNILIVDKKSDEVDYAEADCNVFFVEEIGIENYLSYALKYNVIEYNTFTKPFFIDFLFKKFNYSAVMYLDPDMLVCEALDEVFEALETKAFAVTPHKITRAARAEEGDMLIRKSGFFNLGFCAVSNTEKGKEIISAWANDLLDNCFSDNANHLFTDQKSIASLFYYFYNDFAVLNDPGLNFAPWNFCERTLTEKDGKYYAMLNSVGQARSLKLFHVSGFNVYGGEEFFTTKHVEMDLSSQTILKKFLVEYRADMLDKHYEQYHKIKYAFNYFDNGLYISRFERRIYGALIGSGSLSIEQNGFSVESDFFKLLKKNKLLTKQKIESVDLKSANILKKDGYNKKEKVVKAALKFSKMVLGVTNYALLIKYLPTALKAENQTYLIKGYDKNRKK